jgi:prepilin-type N-terminal cleavage/methylation domain-containing protein
MAHALLFPQKGVPVTTKRHSNHAAGFTLVEIMIVVSIIGLLCAISLPAVAKARLKSRATTQVNDLRILEDAFQLYAMENRGFPAATGQSGELPPGMEAYVRGNTFSTKPPAGLSYCWISHVDQSGITEYGIQIVDADLNLMTLVDTIADDGTAESGRVQSMPPNYVLILGR